MTGSVTRQDKLNPVATIILATQASKMALSCPFGTTRCVPRPSLLDQECFFNALAWTSTPSRLVNKQIIILKKTWQISILSPLYLDRTGLVNNSMGLLLVSGKASDCYAASLGFDFRSEKKTGNYFCNNFELFSLSRFLERHIEKAKLTDYLFC